MLVGIINNEFISNLHSSNIRTRVLSICDLFINLVAYTRCQTIYKYIGQQLRIHIQKLNKVND